MTPRQHIRALCELHGYASVLDDVRASLECSWGRYVKNEQRATTSQGDYIDTLACLDKAVRLTRRIPIGD